MSPTVVATQPPALDPQALVISPSSLYVQAADKCAVLRIVVYLLWLHECADMCFRCHLVQRGSGASSGDLRKKGMKKHYSALV